MTVVVFKVRIVGAANSVVSDSMESNAASVSGDARDGLAGVVME